MLASRPSTHHEERRRHRRPRFCQVIFLFSQLTDHLTTCFLGSEPMHAHTGKQYEVNKQGSNDVYLTYNDTTTTNGSTSAN